MAGELLTPQEMGEADRLTVAAGVFDGPALMARAGAAVAAEVLARYPDASRVDVLCGPGNNGGDGYVVAELLRRAGVAVSIYAEGGPAAGTDAHDAASRCSVAVEPLSAFSPRPGTLVVDALYGAGLARAVSGDVEAAIERTRAAGCRVVAVDLPSGVPGLGGRVLGAAFRADVTVTFARRKPGHLLLPGREACGEVVLADIGITDETIAAVAPACFENGPALWSRLFPTPAVDAHKYSRGHVGVFSGPAAATGAARLSAMAAARTGAGAVTVLSPGSALAANAAHLTSIILRRSDTLDDALDFVETRRPAALVYGPGLAPDAATATVLLDLLARAAARPLTVVVDASALTALALAPGDLLAAAASVDRPKLVMTPHEGEFSRLFHDLARDQDLSKLDRARSAARRADAVVVLKGPDTVIAAPDGRAAINANGTPLLATAGSGDVLSGIIAGLCAQSMPAFEAACAAVWMHAEAAKQFGPGLIAEDLPLALRPVLADLHAGTHLRD
jgi:hydroxyethylthiazole kinase-like uncharacterized protein yjeF